MITSIKKPNETKPKQKLIEIQEEPLAPKTEEENENEEQDINLLVKLLLNSNKKSISTTSTKTTTTEKSSDDDLLLSLLGATDEEEEEEELVDLLIGRDENDEKRISSRSKDEQSEEEQDYSAVETALTKLFGDNPEDDDKISPENLEIIIELDRFLQQEQRRQNAMKRKLENLADEAINLVYGSIKRFE